ncbi:DUF3696 domain-containing protein [Mesorhizobium sp. CU2]|uniref:DUF3696 domain-containing protein n=1 Tax=unclassified Mesorhizobium TaxID=325217 RepID=UPI001125EE8B|nr:MULTISPECIES: DUF3696 domain-containing protein [unclassified Mesorhizobium]TPN77460.1 DUF3696 domain-containing protein [Mesorhizobium sp. CU3]TPO05448.1 DUF3696 domain-containing protein [Mesorhizobium sp. CU2]
MLESIVFENFKTWPKADLKFGRITGLFGTNSSGKSSILQFLLTLKQTKEATDRTISLELNGTYVSLGGYYDAVYSHDEALDIKWNVSFSTPEPISLVDPSAKRTQIFVKSDQIKIRGEVGVGTAGLVGRRLTYQVGDSQTFSLSSKRSDSTAFELKASGSSFRFIRTPGRAWQIPGPVKGYAFPDQARTYFQNASFLSDLEAVYERQIDGIYYLGPLREYPKREYVWSRSRPRDVGIRGEKTIEAILAATISNETRNLKTKARLKTFQEMVAYWLSELGLIKSFDVIELAKGSNYWQARVQVREGGPTALLTDVGFGVSQVLPIITLLYFVPEGSTVILEQPEIHLHPLAQANLADLIINVATHRNIQVIFESHSEHLILRLQRRIAEGEVSNKDISLYFCEAPEGESILHPLKVDLYGQIENWPENFMGDAFGETVAAEKARLKRMRTESK